MMGITYWQYYLKTAEKIVRDAYSDIDNAADWKKKRSFLHEQYMKSMQLHPLPERSGLKVERHGKFSGDGFSAEKIAYEILPSCWGSANVYLPTPVPQEPLPGILYLCGHKTIGIEGYHQHAVMWARRGYACLVFDTIEQHDGRGNHHGTYYGQRFDWISMGYTGAGGELFNSIRALDILCGLPEVDSKRIGVTGISGGGAQSFFLAAADNRVKALATSCGVAMQNYTLAKRQLQQHCDCMYINNLYQKSIGEYAGLIAPRPALYCFASKDNLFSPPEYKLLYSQAKKAYELMDASDNCELFEYEAPHMYKPESVVKINSWMDKHVAGKEMDDVSLNEPELAEQKLTVFNGCPPTENKMHVLPELLSPLGSIPLPQSKGEWHSIQKDAIDKLKEEVFIDHSNMHETLETETVGLWEDKPGPGEKYITRHNSYKGSVAGMDTWVYTHICPEKTDNIIVGLCGRDETAFDMWRNVSPLISGAQRFFAVEGRTGGINGSDKFMGKDYLRAGALIGLSPVKIMIRDYLLHIDFINSLPYIHDHGIYLYGKGEMGVAAIYATLLDERVKGVVADSIPSSHRMGAYIPGILKIMDIDHAIGLLAPRPVELVKPAQGRNNWSQRVYARLGCPESKIITNKPEFSFC